MSLQLAVVPTPGIAQRIFTTLLISCDEVWISGHAREGTKPSKRQTKEGADEEENNGGGGGGGGGGGIVVRLQSYTLSRIDPHTHNYTWGNSYVMYIMQVHTL